MEEYTEVWLKTFRDKGHEPVLNEDRVDLFAVSSPGHNGPKCAKCGWSCCYWCTTPPHIPECSEFAKKVRNKGTKRGNDKRDSRRNTGRKNTSLRFKNREAITR
jgi:hypothetical protein